jgi:hypothetical protein
VNAYLAWDDARLEGAWQGIRRLVLDRTTPAQPILHVELNLAPSGIAAEDVVVIGSRVPSTLGPPTFDTVNRRITMQFDGVGTRATYHVQLLSGGNDDLHPLFALAAFQFAIDCEGADCRPVIERAPRSDRPAPQIDYTTRDEAGFQELLANHVRVRHDDWGDLAPAALERVLVDLLAHHGDMLAYYQDRVGNEAFVATARARHSLHQHGLLLGYAVGEGVAGTTLLAFEVENPGWVPAGLAVRSASQSDDDAIVYTTVARVPVRPEHNRLTVAAWPGAMTATVPARSTRLLLLGHGLGLRTGMQLALVTRDDTFVVDLVDAVEMMLPGWVASPAAPAPGPIVDAAVTEVRWSVRQELPRAIAPWAPGEDLLVRANLVDATFGEPRIASTHPPVDGATVAIDSGDRAATTVLTGARILVRALRVPEAPIVWEQAGDRVVPALEVDVADHAGVLRRWHRQDHLHASRPFDRHYAVSPDSGGVLWIELGDDVRGAAVDAGTRIRLQYRRGRTGGGNCPRRVLSVIDPPLRPEVRDDLERLGAVAVENVLPGSGGQAPESNDAARESIPASLRRARPRQRAVALTDYARAAEEVEGVARATARALGGVFNTVLVLVDPKGEVELDADLRGRVWRHLDHLRMAGREHFVDAPLYVPLDVELWICAQPGIPRHHVRERVLAALRPGTDDRPGWFHPDRLSFAQTVELGELIALVQAIAGVRSVKARTFRRLLVPSDLPVEPRIALRQVEVARLDADLADPDHGRLEVKVVGLGGIDEDAYDLAVAGGAP